ncbi:anti-phage deoxyguanosine triphosphatase [Gluconobacter sphaericus]|uniref:anti-phage deoxyguanosine triphosphatase n=1 Tax=Gluconobacter sphaericus TaxID=574987 RepID=UPI00312BBC24
MDIWSQRHSGANGLADDARTPYGVDYSRIVHSASFRRLQGKTQLLAVGDSDFHRTRLTHSLEVAQVAEGIVQHLGQGILRANVTAILPEPSLIRAIALAHDLGHPPFGHGGETALNGCMQGQGGFEGNGQTLRLLARLEWFSENFGTDLTRRALLGVLKYPVSYSAAISGEEPQRAVSQGCAIGIKPPKCYLDNEKPIVDWILEPLGDLDRERFTQLHKPKRQGHAKTLHKSFDCTIMDVADDIAYGVHDLEDAVALSLVDRFAFQARIPPDICGPFFSDMLRSKRLTASEARYDGFVDALFGDERRRKRIIGLLVNHLVRSVEIVEVDAFEEPLLRYRVHIAPVARPLLDSFQALLVETVINSARVQQIEYKGKKMVAAVFGALSSDPTRLLPDAYWRPQATEEDSARLICDYVASMTDGALLKTYGRLFSPGIGSAFDQI